MNCGVAGDGGDAGNADFNSPRPFHVVVAANRSMGIGAGGSLPWRLAGDMAHFKRLTQTPPEAGKINAVVMGRRTWESIPAKFRPLPGRLNVVLSRRSAMGNHDQDFNSSSGHGDSAFPPGVLVFSGLDDALGGLAREPHASNLGWIFVIGGGQVYEAAVRSPLCTGVHMTLVEQDEEGAKKCDTFFPEASAERFRVWAAAVPARDSPEGERYSFMVLAPAGQGPVEMPPGAACGHEEEQYLNLIKDIITTGARRGDRTGTGTFSKFGCQMRFNLRHTFPLLTTKRVFWRGVVEELLWFMSGSTNARNLAEKDVHIWDDNGSREFLDRVGLTDREEGDLGPVYGFQWRHFGAKYVDMRTDYTGQGVDQLADVIHKIKTNPNDRRIVMTAWNPADLGKMALPPCHMFCQFYVADGELSCQLYQRSCDMGLGVPFNIASYALLTCLVAHVCGLKPGDFVHALGDAHVYCNHVEPLKEQLKNSPRHFPVLELNKEVTDIDAFTMDDIKLVGYNPHKKIAMKMAV
ncbi:unnamed protein product [Ostreobium quekettii]|uniref:Bifunctional dihydrofolate reductase-thymidylate synthase n=1 Tax=Ostreobium quekettii TaxID=121088 RepID=A0A8S1J685_9CHLO|nr:unnamed protein product [Ostreobium quekettii]|eukprot:evm.model.scf_406EXC.3 EVM.evm.TU.scf_406EXC.3   scf_406EXC:20565-26117(+)